MQLSNYHSEKCRQLIAPIIAGAKRYKWEHLQRDIYALFESGKGEYNVNLWYTLMLMEDGDKLFFGFVNEFDKPEPGAKIVYNGNSYEVTKTGKDNGYHGWCNLIIIEVKQT